MDKTAPKSLLPSPNFDKKAREPSSSLHYLTPSGMTLLPRSKQPPPMYGKRGSTVPAKFLQKEEQQQPNVDDAPPIYTPTAQPEFCVNCGMQLATAQDMRRHEEQHVPCPADGCDFTALANILERHIEANHITGLYKTVKKAWTPEEIAAWRAERRKKFPTAANVEQAERAKEQRLKRGERLEASKARFGKREDRRRTRPQNEKQPRPRPAKRQKSRHNKGVETKTKPTQLTTEEPPNCSSTGVAMFRGTSQLTDYKHFKNKAATEVHALSNMLGMYGSESESEADEAMEDETTSPAEIEPTPVEDQPIKGSDKDLAAVPAEITLEGQSCRANSEDISVDNAGSSDEAPDEAPIERKTEILLPEAAVQNPSTAQPPRANSEDISIDKAGSSDEAPDEAPIERKTEAPLLENLPTAADKAKPSSQAAKHPALAPKPRQRFYGLNYKRARQLRSQNTMLEKLLTPDIRHERNVLLQCVRFVCEQKFFGIGAATATPTIETSSDNIPNTT